MSIKKESKKNVCPKCGEGNMTVSVPFDSVAHIQFVNGEWEKEKIIEYGYDFEKIISIVCDDCGEVNMNEAQMDFDI